MTRPRGAPPANLRRLAPALLLLLGGCVEPTLAGAWERVDLWSTRPEVVVGDASGFSPMLGFHGPEEARDLTRLRPADLARIPVLRSPRIHALRQEPGTVLRWRLQLGREPYVAFTPGGVDLVACQPAAQVSVATEGSSEPTTLVWGELVSASRLLPAEVVLPLDRWQGSSIELLFQVSGGCAMLWGSPEVVSRRTVRREARRATPERPNILLIGVDTLRADALGAWGRRPSLTPALDALATESDVWPEAFSVANATNPSFASIFTGLYVHHHGVVDLDHALGAQHVTLAERLREAGYQTTAILAAQHVGPHRSGLGQGYEQVITAENTSAARLVVSQALRVLEARRGRPFFLWTHLFDPHTPHAAPAPYAVGMRAQQPYGLGRVRDWVPFRTVGPRAFTEPMLGASRDLYDAEVAYLDREVDRLLGYLRDRGLLENTVIALVSDHGENLEDHGVNFRHAGLWDTTTHVPLMIRWPGERRQGRRLPGMVQTIDLYPTLLAAAGLTPNPQDGRDLRTLTGEGKSGRRAVFAAQSDGSNQGASVRTPRFRYFHSVGSRIVRDGEYLYDLTADPGEQVNLAGRGKREEAELRELLRRWRQGVVGGAAAATGDPEIDAELRALGYL